MAHDGTFASFLARSLGLLERELPWAYEAMSRALAPREVLIEVDRERVGVACASGAVRVEGAARAPAVECRTTRRAILDMIDGRSTLLEAVVSDAVSLRGSVDDLLAFHDGLMIFLGGAVRSPSFPWLLKEFRIDASAR